MFLPALFKAAGLPPIDSVSDCAWSYEFEEHDDSGKLKQIDVAIHYRDAAGDGLLIVEAKRPGGTLKPSDANADYYLNLPAFRFADRRNVLYLVDAADLPKLATVTSSSLSNIGKITWQGLRALQVELASGLPVPTPVRCLTQVLLAWHFDHHGFTAPSSPAHQRSVADLACLLKTTRAHLGLPGTIQPELKEEALEQIQAALKLDASEHVRHFLAAGIQYQCCAKGIDPDDPCFSYLKNEPSLDEIRVAHLGGQRTAERRYPYWRLQ
jgi:hypothetical protein